MSTEKQLDVNKIIDRMKSSKRIKTDADLARFLDIRPGTLSAWRKRETLDYERHEYIRTGTRLMECDK